jgi:hypothetical protein
MNDFKMNMGVFYGTGRKLCQEIPGQRSGIDLACDPGSDLVVDPLTLVCLTD